MNAKFENEKFDRDMCVALARLGFKVNDSHYETAEARCIVSITHPADEDFWIEIITPEGGHFSYRARREQILSAARAIDHEVDA